MRAQKITAKQIRFVSEYMIDLNATQAAVRAGYSAKTADRIGPKLLVKSCVAQAVANAQAKRALRSDRTALQVLKDIQDVTRQAREDNDFKTALKGLELEARHLGLFNDKLAIKADVSVTREELDAAAKAALLAAGVRG